MEEENLMETDKINSVEDIIKNINDKKEENKEEKPKKKRVYKPRKKKEVVIQPTEMIKQLDCIAENPLEDEMELKRAIVEDLDILCYKFKDIVSYKPNYSYPETSIEELKRQKGLFLRIIGEKASINSAYECLSFMIRGVEKVSGSLKLVDIEGLSGDLELKKDSITDILSEMVDMDIISVQELSPEIKLAILMTNITINRMEQNRAKKKGKIVVEIEEGVESHEQ